MTHFRTPRVLLLFAVLLTPLAAMGDEPTDDIPQGWTLKYTEQVRVAVIDGVPTPQFAIKDFDPPGTSIGDTLSFAANVTAEDRLGNEMTGELLGHCVASGVEERSVPVCPPGPPCAEPDALAPLYFCRNVLVIDDAEEGRNGRSTLVTEGYVRQLEAGGDPPGVGVEPLWLVVSGGTGRFAGAVGEVRTLLAQTATPPPIKTSHVYLTRTLNKRKALFRERGHGGHHD